VSEREQAGRTVYRVRVGPFQNRDAPSAQGAAGRRGFDAALVRVQRDAAHRPGNLPVTAAPYRQKDNQDETS
jgi:hypothetical protein